MKTNQILEKSLLSKLLKDGVPRNDVSYSSLTEEEFTYFTKKVATSLTVDIYRNSIIEDYHSELEDLTQEVMKNINIDVCDRMYVKVISGSASDKYIPYMFIAAFVSLWNPADWLEPSAIPYLLDIATSEYVRCQQEEDGLNYHIEILACVNNVSFMLDIADFDKETDVFWLEATDDIIENIFNGKDILIKSDFYAIMRNATEFSYSIEIDED